MSSLFGTSRDEQLPDAGPWSIRWWLERQHATSEIISIDPTDNIDVWINKNAPIDSLEYDSIFNALEYSTQVPPYSVKRYKQFDEHGWTHCIRVRGPLNDLIIHARQLNELTQKLHQKAGHLAENSLQTDLFEGSL